ncbi:MAG: hypothetical protein ACREMY_15675 [bacterium]
MVRVWICSSFCIALLVASPAAAQGGAACKPLSDAMLKAATTPHHMQSTESGRPESGESIMTGDAFYFKYKGAWQKSPRTPADQRRQEEENIKTAKVYTCQSLRTEAVNGVQTVVYKVHSENETGKTDGLVWMAPSLGLPVRSEQDIDTMGPRMHMVTTWDYVNIKAPVVK